jgi:hypothetical protein
VQVRRQAKRKKLQTHPDKTGEGAGSSDAVQRVQVRSSDAPETNHSFKEKALTRRGIHAEH